MGVQCYIFASYSQRKRAVKLLPKNLEAIIFDLGGVVLNLNPQKTIDAFVLASGLPPEKVAEAGNSKLFKNLEKGLIDTHSFRSELNRLLGTQLQDEEIDMAWNAMLLDLPLDRLLLLSGLRLRYKTFVLSNTNEIHINAFDEIVQKVTGGESIQKYFDNVYYSHQVEMRKPDAEIFEMVLKRNSLHPSKTLFIDDTLEHIESANRLGLHTWHLTNQDELFAVFGND